MHELPPLRGVVEEDVTDIVLTQKVSHSKSHIRAQPHAVVNKKCVTAADISSARTWSW